MSPMMPGMTAKQRHVKNMREDLVRILRECGGHFVASNGVNFSLNGDEVEVTHPQGAGYGFGPDGNLTPGSQELDAYVE